MPTAQVPIVGAAWDNPGGSLSLSTSLPELEAGAAPALSRRRIHRRRRRRRGWVVVGALIALLLTAGGGLLAYANTLPTSVSLNIKNGEKDVPTYSRLVITFSRDVDLKAVQAAFSITPAADGILSPASGHNQYAWSPTRPLSDLTTYTVTVEPLTDLSHHRVPGGRWSFITNIIPHVSSVTVTGGEAISDGAELLPGTPLTINFNDTMDPTTIKVTMRSAAADLKWADDFRSASIVTTGLASGPLVLQLAPGGHDQTGHPMAGTFTLKAGLYYHYSSHTTALRYPALIQIPNDQFAWDQNGLQAADIVFEYLAEGGITRCTAIFQNAPDLVGPMRSSRFISLKIARHYKGLLFQSGESQATRARAASDPVPQFFDTKGYTFRTGPPRYAPDNLMISGGAVNSAEALYPGIGTFALPKARPDLAAGTPWPRVVVDEHYSVYTYDPGQGTYTKAELRHTLSDSTLKKPLQIEMVVVLHTAEWLVNVGDGHGAHIHDFDLDSGGGIEMYYQGMRYTGAWTGPDSHGPLAFTVGGQAVTLPPGLVWIDVTA